MRSIVARRAPEGPAARRWWIWAGVAVGALLVLARFLPDTGPESDFAIIDLSVLNVLHGAQLVGMYSRFGWHHPGPLYFELLSPAYWLSGYRHFSIDLTVAALNVACVLGIIAILRRQRESSSLLVGGLLVGGAYLAGALGLLSSPWTPYVVLLPYGLLIFAGASLACGDLRWLPLVALTASFVVETHVGPVLSVMVVTTAASVLAAMRMFAARVRHASVQWRTPLLLTLAVIVLAWWPPVVDELRANGLHNLRAIAEFFRHTPPAAGKDATYAFEYFFIAPLSPHLGLTWGPTQPPPQAWIPPLAAVQAGLLLLVVVRSFWRRERFVSMAGVLTIAGAISAYMSIQRLPETPKDYTVLWVSILGVASWILIVTAGIDLWIARSRARISRSPVTERSVVRVAVAVLAILAAVHVTARRIKDQGISARVAAVTGPIDAALLDSGVTEVLVHVPQSLWGRAAAVVLHLAREGKSPRVDPDWVSMFGRQYASTGGEPAEISFVDADEHQLLQHRTDEHLLGQTDALFIYFRAAPSTAHVASVSPKFETSHEAIGDLSAGLTFIGPSAFAQFSLPAVPAIGIRIQGQGGTRWRISCAGDAGTFNDIGSVTIGSADGARAADAFLRDLPACRHLRLYATSQVVTQRLSGIQLLTR